MTPLKIEVTEAMRDEYFKVFYDPSHDSNDDALIAALTAAFQHPEFVRQVREQAMGCVPEEAKRVSDDAYIIECGAITLTVNMCFAVGYKCAADQARASLGRLLGEEGK
jgi:hypothetical protein